VLTLILFISATVYFEKIPLALAEIGYCGDGICNTTIGENPETCPQDCLSCSVDNNCTFCGAECVIKREDMVCPSILPPKGYKCACIKGNCKKVPDVKLLLKTDKPVYRKGEKVIILVKNVGEVPLKLPATNDDYFRIDYIWSNETAGGIKNIYPFDCEWMRGYKPEIILQPGESKIFEWNQRVCPDLTQAKPGKYEIEVKYKAVNDEILGSMRLFLNENYYIWVTFDEKTESTEFRIAPEVSLEIIPECSNNLITVRIDNNGVDPSDEITVKAGKNTCNIPSIQPNSSRYCMVEAYTQGINLITINTTGITESFFANCEFSQTNVTPPPEVNISPPSPADKTRLLEVLILLEQLRIKFDNLRATTQSISNYYENTNNIAKATCWKEVGMMFDAILLKIDGIKAEINLIKDNPTQEDLERIKGMVTDIRVYVDRIIDKIFGC